MRIKISDESVRQNVAVFLEALHKAGQGEGQPSAAGAEKVYNAWLHLETGQLRFAQLAGESEYLEKKQWKPVRFTFQYNPTEGEIAFLLDEGEKDLAFHGKDLSPAALQILQKTMKVFTELGKKLKGPSDLDTKMAVLFKLAILPATSDHARNLMIDLWQNADRMQAESLLAGKPVGTYLFRKDPYAAILEEQLKGALSKEVHCFTLTYSQEDSQISDCTIVHVDGGWQIYNDDPSLQMPPFSDLKELVASFKGELRYPLYQA